MQQQRTTRSERQEHLFNRRQITKRSLTIIAVVERYRFVPTSFIIPIVSGDPRTTEHHLQMIFHKGLLNRFQPTRNGEFIYFLDNVKTAELLIDEGECSREQIEFEAIRNNREKRYAESEDPGKRLFINHELMIRRFHFMLEMACLKSEGRFSLSKWQQGAALHQSVRLSEMSFDSVKQVWYENDKSERVPHRPDAMFSISFLKEPQREPETFFYEADRKTITKRERMRNRFRAHFHFIVKTRKHQQVYGVRKIRAVLVETVDGAWGEHLREEARHPTVTGAKPSQLFWFTTSQIFSGTETVERRGKTVEVPRFLLESEIIFKAIWVWASPVDDTLLSMIGDEVQRQG